MSICQVCKYQTPDNATNFCPNCGATLKLQAQEPADDSVPEVRLPDDPNDPLPTSPEPSEEEHPRPDDDIQICRPGDYVGNANESDTARIKQPFAPGSAADTSSEDLRRLSPEQAEKIRSSFYSDTSREMTPADASAMLKKMTAGDPTMSQPTAGDAGSADLPAAPPEQPAPITENLAVPTEGQDTDQAVGIQQSPPVRHAAFFHKNFIQLAGGYPLASGDEILIGDRHYLLRPKKIEQKYIIAAFAAVIVIVMVIVGSQLLSPTLPGNGNIVGLVLDQEGRPMLNGIEITLPEAGRRAEVDALGFFHLTDVPTGTYLLKCKLVDGSVRSENISVVGDEVTTVTLSPKAQQQTTYSSTPATVTGESYAQQSTEPAVNQPTPANQPSGQSSTGATTKGPSALKVNANVDDAKVALDGEVLGVGNLVYKKLTAGSHTVTVTRDGYTAWKGTVQLKPNETYTLAVTLETPAATTESPSYSAEDFYQSGKTMLGEGNAAAATQDFTEAIKLRPTMADAYVGRGEAYWMAGNQIAAENDLIRAGKIYADQKRYQAAQDLYTRVLETNKMSIPAMLALADLSERRDDHAAAMTEYNKILKLDKDNFQANFEMGKALYAAGQNKDADKRLRRAQELDPNVPEVYHYLMLNYFARDDFSKVKKTFADFTLNVSSDEVAAFKTDPKFDALVRIIGDYERPE